MWYFVLIRSYTKNMNADVHGFLMFTMFNNLKMADDSSQEVKLHVYYSALSEARYRLVTAAYLLKMKR